METGRDVSRFLGAWAKAPLRIGAVAPSGPSLARIMTAGIGPGTGPVIELGPGTGVFTRALLAQGVAEEDLLLVERTEAFAALLRARFPKARVVTGQAEEVSAHAAVLDRAPGAVISGLPLLAFPPESQRAVLRGVFATLDPAGTFRQFTYGPKAPVRAEIARELGLVSRRIGGTWRNLPPAAVYGYERG